jgi:RecA-family ATPase
VFGGDEINRSQVRKFVSMLRGLAIEYDCAVLLLSHPSLTGPNSGTGTSGSTAWNN